MAQLESLKVDFIVDNTQGIKAIDQVIASMKQLKKLGQTTLKVKASYKDVYKTQEAVEKVTKEVKEAKKESTIFASKFKQAMKSAKTDSEKSSLSIAKALDRVTYKISRVFKFLTFTYLGRQIVVLGDRLVKFGSDISEIENLFEVAMKDMADEANKYAERVSDSWGYSVYRIKEQIAYLHQMYTAMGITEETAYGMSKAVLEMGYNLASLYNLDPQDMIEKIKSGTLGISRPLKQIGIVTNVAQLEMTALKYGIISTSREMTSQEKALATVWAVWEQGINALESGEYVVDGVTHKMGDLSKTLMTNANLLRQLKSRLQQVVETFGLAFQPVINTVLPYLVAFAKVLKELGESLALFIGRFYGLNSMEDIIGKFGSTSKKQLEDVGTEAEETAKKISNLTGSIDELNVLDTSDKGEGMQGGTIENDIGVPDFDTIFEGAMTPINEKAEKIKEIFKSIFAVDFFSGFKDGFNSLKVSLKDVIYFIKEMFDTIRNNEAFQILVSTFQTTINTITAYFSSFTSNFRAFWDTDGRSMFDTFVTFISDMATKMLEIFNNVILPIIGSVVNFISTNKDLISLVAQGIVAFEGYTIVSGIFDKIKLAITAIKPAFGIFVKAFSKFGASVLLTKNVFTSLGIALKTALTSTNALVAGVALLIGVFTKLYMTNEDFRESVNNILKSIGEVFKQLAQAIAPILKNIFEIIVTIIKAVSPVFEALIKTAIPVIKSFVGWFAERVQAFLPVLDVISRVLHMVSMSIQEIVRFLGDMIGKVVELGKSGFGKIAGWFGGVKDKITGWFGGNDEEKEVPHFASGGLVYGDTIARVGEYSSARSNPEVIAPLSDLSSIIRQELANMVINMPDQPIEVTVVTELDGRELARSVNEVNSRRGYSYDSSL